MRLYEQVLRSVKGAGIPAHAAAKLETMREQRDTYRARSRSLGEDVKDARNLLHGLEREYARLADSASLGGLRRFENDGRGGQNVTDGRETLDQSRQAIDRQNAEIKRLLKMADEANSKASEFARLPQRLEQWLDGVGRQKLKPFTGSVKPKLQAGEVWVAAIERSRRVIANLKAERHRVASAPIPASEAKILMRREIDTLAEAGAPDVSPYLEGGAIRWPVAPLKRGDGSVITFDLLDVRSLLVWLDRDRLISRLEAEIDATSDPDLAMSVQQRRVEDARLVEKLLLAEREEEALIVSAAKDSVMITRRPDADPRAVLEVADNVPGHVEED